MRILRALMWCADSPSPLKVVLTVREPAFVMFITLKRPLLFNTFGQRTGAIVVMTVFTQSQGPCQIGVESASESSVSVLDESAPR